MKKTRQAIKDRFKTGMYPTESDFGDAFDSYVHKDDAVDVSKVVQGGVDGSQTTLQTILNNKAEASTVTEITTRVQTIEQKTGNVQDIEILQQSMSELSRRMDTVETQATRTFSFRGSVDVATINALDTSTLTAGDVYNITDSGTVGTITVSEGDCLCWNGSEWSVLSYTDYTAIYQQIERKLDIQQLGYPTFSATDSYDQGDIVIHEGYIVRFTTAHTAGQWNPEKTEDLSIREILEEYDTTTLFTLVTQVQQAQTQQQIAISQVQTTAGQNTTKIGELDDRVAELERTQGDIDLSAVYEAIDAVDQKADGAVSDAAAATTTANQAKTLANSVSSAAQNALQIANQASTVAQATSTLATSLSSSVSELGTTVEGLRSDIGDCIVNGGGVTSARVMTVTAYEQLVTKNPNTFYILTE